MRGLRSHSAVTNVLHRPPTLVLFVRGFLALLPLWTGAVPVGIAYGVAARGAGLSLGETQLMSLVVFSAAAQVSAVSLIEAGAPVVMLIGTSMALNAQLLLLGLAIGRQVRLSWTERLATAWFLTDGAYGVTAAGGRLRLPVLLGAGVSMFVAWNVGTALGAVAGHAVPDPRRLGIDLVVPLAFLAVLVPLVRTRTAAFVALVAGVTAFLLLRLAPGGVAVLGAGLAGSVAGSWRTRRERGNPAGDRATERGGGGQ
ncbi:MAG: AzlC family ABC transporter permease [Chloroflexota bacterium]